jgi:hypothetical protein
LSRTSSNALDDVVQAFVHVEKRLVRGRIERLVDTRNDRFLHFHVRVHHLLLLVPLHHGRVPDQIPHFRQSGMRLRHSEQHQGKNCGETNLQDDLLWIRLLSMLA